MFRILLLLVSCCFATTAFAVDIPQPDEYVTDTSNLLSASTEAQLETTLAAYEAETGTELAILTVPLIPDGLSANEYATLVGNDWGIGKDSVDNGALLLIETDDAPGQRDIYIATGSQLEGGLTDLEAAAIVNEVIIPRFQQGAVDAGVVAGVDAMIQSLAGESFTELRMASGSDELSEEMEMWLAVLSIFIFVVVPWLGAVLGRSKEIWPGGVLGGVAGGTAGLWFSFALLGILITVVALGLLGLAFDYLVSSEYKKAKRGRRDVPWWAGGNSGGRRGGGFGGFGGGGFSGGGGGGRW